VAGVFSKYPKPSLESKQKTRRIRQLAYTGLLLGKKSRLRGRIPRVAKVAQADANQAKPLVRPEADTF
jgi:hypothetical protein